MSTQTIREQLNIDPVALEKEENDQSIDNELWSPKWHCFCCMDSGIVAFHLARIAVENYTAQDDMLACNYSQQCRNHIKDTWVNSLSYVVDQQTCQKLHYFNRQQWEEWKAKNAKQVAEAVKQFTEEF